MQKRNQVVWLMWPICLQQGNIPRYPKEADCADKVGNAIKWQHPIHRVMKNDLKYYTAVQLLFDLRKANKQLA